MKDKDKIEFEGEGLKACPFCGVGWIPCKSNSFLMTCDHKEDCVLFQFDHINRVVVSRNPEFVEQWNRRTQADEAGGEEKCPDCGGEVKCYHDTERTRVVCKARCQGYKVLREIDRTKPKADSEDEEDTCPKCGRKHILEDDHGASCYLAGEDGGEKLTFNPDYGDDPKLLKSVITEQLHYRAVAEKQVADLQAKLDICRAVWRTAERIVVEKDKRIEELEATVERWKDINREEIEKVLDLWKALGISSDNMLPGKTMAELEIETVNALKAVVDAAWEVKTSEMPRKLQEALANLDKKKP